MRKTIARPLSVLSFILHRTPGTAWAFLALFGALTLGTVFGYASALNPEREESQNELLQTQNEKLINLVDRYEELAKIYRTQGEHVAFIMDWENIQNDPAGLENAFSEVYESQDVINIQYGRIYELRKAAGLHSSSTQTD